MLTEQDYKSLACECLHKVEVKNPFTQELLLVPCGQCPACLYSKSIQHELKAKAVRSMYKYCYFCTLTYDVYNIPSYSLSYDILEDGNYRVTGSDTHRRDIYGRSCVPDLPARFDRKGIEDFTFICTPEYYARFTSQADLGKRRYRYDQRFAHTYGYLNRVDFSLFFKRFRKLLFQKAQCYEPLRIYFVGEYGPEHFRPHFHFLLFFQSDKIAESVGESLRKSWRLGRVDWSQDRQTATTYVASYLNSFTTIPYHIKEHRPIRPFSRFSNGFIYQFFERTAKEVAQGDFTHALNGTDCVDAGTRFKIFPDNSVLRTVVYKPCSYRGATVHNVSRLISAVFRISRRPAFQRCSSIFKKTRLLGQHIVRLVQKLYRSPHFSIDHELREVLHFINFNPRNLSFLLYKDWFDRLHGALYRLFYDTNEFLRGQRNSFQNLRYNEDSLYLRIINSIRFYHEKCSTYFKSRCQSLYGYPDDLRYYFVRASQEQYNELRKSPLGMSILQYQRNLCYQRIKHREINDRNQFFNLL
ncbi:replication initiator protein [Dipodfec virus UOA04_Rod_446]|nr:replication initiator protein [Dipodfec virus UOA04_Rod_446]